ncbi:MAG: phosphorelay protein [Rhodospirillales bacterium]|jgi:hypothetical protein|nr:phosphorelay protein [Rhodospirillales bacterium]MDP6884392.1 phosphorelay protein [Rhodospirillales bacterium]
MAENDNPRLIVPPNPLKSKVGIGGPGAVTPEALERAESVIADLGDDYLKWVEADLEKLQTAMANLKAAQGNNSGEVAEIFQIAHDIKGQGGSFDYQLMTEIGVIEVHVDALRLVIAEKMKGDGGKAGDSLYKGLEMVVAKVSG